MFNSHPWVFQIRKEVFSPSEQLTNPTTIHLVFCQAIKTSKFFIQFIISKIREGLKDSNILYRDKAYV